MADRLSYKQTARLAVEELECRHGAGPRGALKAGTPVRVVRLDRSGAYLLVPVRTAAGLRGIVQLDEASGRVESSAVVRDPASTFLLDAASALAAARQARPGHRSWGSPLLGWRPCRECPSSLRPLWVIPHGGGTTYVTQEGEVLDSLTQGRGG